MSNILAADTCTANSATALKEGMRRLIHLAEQTAARQVRQVNGDLPVWIFGAGNFGQEICAVIVAAGFVVRGFVETNPREKMISSLPVLNWTEWSDGGHAHDQLVIGIYNRDAPFDQLFDLAKRARATNIFSPIDIYAQFPGELGWRYWLSTPELLLSHLMPLAATYQMLADTASRDCLINIVAFRLGLQPRFGSYQHDDHQYFNDLTLPALLGRPIRFVDGGAYNGDTFLELNSHVDISHAYLFEPDEGNYSALQKNIVEQDGCSTTTPTCLPLALSNRYEILSFSANSGEGAALSESGSSCVAAVALDSLLLGSEVDFIKLDVEGAEGLALQGAEALIRRSQPVLAISMYHRPQDLWELPDQLKRMCPNHRFYIRQHYSNSFDVVLYAVPL